MPIQKIKGKYRWGNHGKLYSSKKKAIIQGIAIRASQARAGKRIK